LGYRDLHQPLRLAVSAQQRPEATVANISAEIKFFRFEFQATGFDFGKVKDIVNQR